MRRISVNKALIPVLTTLLAIGFSLNAFGFEINIDVSPNVLNIESQGEVVTVHTDIAYGLVDASTIYMNGVAIAWWKVDNRGNFVAKFEMTEIKTLDGLVIGGYNKLQLIGATVDGEAFIGEAEIMVIDNVPAGKTTPGAKLSLSLNPASTEHAKVSGICESRR